jgi:hypothetical protein
LPQITQSTHTALIFISVPQFAFAFYAGAVTT